MGTEYERVVDEVGLWGTYQRRNDLCRKYAWAIPSEEALRVIGEYGSVVEGGAGAGYWASLLRARGVDVVAYDVAPYDNPWVSGRWAEVREGGAEQMGSHRDRTLLLVWPPYDVPMGLDHVVAHGGETLIYVGEGAGGCTGDDAFHEYLDEHFEVAKVVRIPQWYGIHDRLTVYRRIRGGGGDGSV